MGHAVETEATEPQDAQSALEGLLAREDDEEQDAPAATQDADQPETEETSGEVESDVESEAAAGQEQEPEKPATRTIKVDGQLVEVTEEELERGYSRQQDYTRKTMKLAEERKVLETQQQETARLRGEYAERLDAMKAFLERDMGPEPDEKLRVENPAEYAAQWTDYQRKIAARDKVQAEQDRLNAQTAQEQQAQFQRYVAQERELLLTALPEWKDAEVQRKEQQRLIDYGTGIGFSEDQLAGLYDHKAVMLLRKAMLYDEAQEKGRAAVKDKAVTTHVLKPGAKQPDQSKPSALDTAKKRFGKSKHPNDAAALIDLMLAEKRLE